MSAHDSAAAQMEETPGLDVAAPAGWSALAIERVRVDAPVNTQLT
jgi:hypothetical protein